MSSLALRNQNDTSTETLAISSLSAANASHHVVLSLFPMGREALESLLAKTEEERDLHPEDYKIDIRHRNLNNTDLRGFSFDAFDVTGCSFENAQLDRISLESLLPAARKGKISLRKINLRGIDLQATLLNRKDLGLITFVPLNMRGIDLEGAVFTDANLTRAILTNANLKAVDFSGADLSLVNAKNADFQEVDFTRATLSGGDFRNCDFRGATFKEAHI